MTTASANLNRVFQALADPTRRAVLQQLSNGPAPVSELAQSFNMTLPSFLQHLDMLENSGLVRSEKSGRVRTYRMTSYRLQAAENWLGRQRTMWEKRLDQLDEHVLLMKEKKR